MNIRRRSLAVCLPTVGLLVELLSACDTFAPPPSRRTNESFTPAETTAAVTTILPPLPVGTVPTSTSGSSFATSAGCSGFLVDRDGDGYTVPDCPPAASPPDPTPQTDDCDDFDPTRHQSQQLFADEDGDGLGSASSSTLWVCEGVEVDYFVSNDADCADDNSTQHEWVLFDGDGDEYGAGESVCGRESANWSLSGGDCTDEDPAVNPAALELALDGVDSNCDTYDVPVFPVDEPGDVTAWTGGALCEGGVLAVVALDQVTRIPGGVHLQIANVGTQPVADATLILNRSTPDSDQPTTSTAVPKLDPGQVVRTERIPYGQYDVHFTYPLFAPLEPALDAGRMVLEAGSDAGVEGFLDASSKATRCAVAQLSFTFSSLLIEPL